MIVGLSGYARAGKDEAAKALQEVGYTRVAFADKLREFLYLLNPVVGITEDSNEFNGITAVRVQEVVERFGWDGYKETVYGTEIRGLLQRLGTECGRDLLGSNVWVNAALNGTQGDIVITDCRFPNEAQAIKDRGGIIVRIVRPGVGPANSHPSETSLDTWQWDYLVTNNSTIEDLHLYIKEAAAKEQVKRIARAARV